MEIPGPIVSGIGILHLSSLQVSLRQVIITVIIYSINFSALELFIFSWQFSLVSVYLSFSCTE